MQWSEVLQDNSLSNLPYKIELNEYGQILMSPASNLHGFLQVEIAFFLRAKQSGKVITECSINTPKGVKVADVAWGSTNFFLKNGLETPYQSAPEICVEIVSPSNSQQEMTEKISLYLQQGTKEVWICQQKGEVTIYNSSGKSPVSKFFANLPKKFEY
ncbi:MAG: Uma2 family endonuclease [Methylococcaceae bacterium]|nr:Uma2 family endonuclease [Methylococcaceae bacterium]